MAHKHKTQRTEDRQEYTYIVYTIKSKNTFTSKAKSYANAQQCDVICTRIQSINQSIQIEQIKID